MEAKENSYKTILKSNIAYFLSYTILIGFIFFLVTFIVKNTFSYVKNPFLPITFSLISAILIYHLLHFICKSSTLEVIREKSMDPENSNMFLKKMNLFFVLCTMFSVLACLGFIYINHISMNTALSRIYELYSYVSPDFAQNVSDAMYEEYYSSIMSHMYSTIIIAMSFVISFISLVPYQKSILEKYNK